MPSRALIASAALALVPAAAAESFAQPARSGRELYEWACAACHGADGGGGPPAAASFPIDAPGFTDCRFASREPDEDWMAVTHDGGGARGFSPLMPAFGGALSQEEIARILGHVRTFCTDASWPRGELNLPRALVTTKAYPEDEAVLTVAAGGDAASATFVYERRIGPRSQVEAAVPLALADSGGGWAGGLGDVALAFKRALYHSLPRGAIFSGAVEVVLPTGSERRGLGSGTAVVEPFVAFGQLLPGGAFLQAQAGAGIAVDRHAADETFWRAVLGRTLTGSAWGRAWSPMVEVLGGRGLASGEPVRWDVVPQMQVTLNTRQHVMLNAGLRIPVNERRGRPTAFVVYLLWDWFDGGLLAGW